MNVLFENSFLKDVEKLKDKKLKLEIDEILTHVETVDSIKEINNLKKLNGFKNAYRIKLKDYRLGIYLIDSKIVFARFLNRKDAYKYFP